MTAGYLKRVKLSKSELSKVAGKNLPASANFKYSEDFERKVSSDFKKESSTYDLKVLRSHSRPQQLKIGRVWVVLIRFSIWCLPRASAGGVTKY